MKLVVCLVLLSLIRQSIQMTPSPLHNCNDNLDVVLVADASRSVGSSFPIIQAAINTFITEITSNNPNIRIGIVFFNDSVQQQPLTKDAFILQNFVNGQTGGSGFTRTDRGIIASVEMLRNQGRPASIVVLTDAISTLPTLTRTAADNARVAGIRMFAIGVNVDATFERELFDITGGLGRVFPLNSVDQIGETIKALGKSLCASTVCSGCNVDSGSGLAPHPTRCDKFYMCERQGNEVKAHEKNCGIGTLWHRRFITCVSTWQALSDPMAGCGYCKVGTRTTFPVADYCQIYYECGVNNPAMLNVNCCPAGQGYDLYQRTCVPGTCAARSYEDNASCRGFYFCNDTVTNPPTLQRNCCQGQSYSVSTQQCETNNNCIGSCEIATWRPCDKQRPHPTNKCMYRSVVNNRVQDMRCDDWTSYSESECACVNDRSCPPLSQTSICKPDVVIPVTNDQENKTWGFSDSSGKWIGVHDVIYDKGTMVLGRATPGYLIIPYFSNNYQAFVENYTFFRVSVLDEFPPSLTPRDMVVLDNRPCPGGFSEAGENPSVWITMSVNARRVTFGVTTVNGPATVTLNYAPIAAAGTWKELTLKYAMSGLLEAGIKAYNIDGNGRRQSVGLPITNTSQATSGRILTSDCPIRIGRSENANFCFRGRVDDVVIYNTCKNGVPDVTAANPTDFGLVP